MEDIERIKDRLDNIESIRPIVSTLKTIAASCWRMAIKRLEAARSYARQVEELISVVMPHLPSLPSLGEGLRRAPWVGLVVMTSERGLCGGFNVSVLETAEDLISAHREEGKEVKLIVLGRRGRMHFSRLGEEIFLFWSMPVARVASFAEVERVGRKLLEWHRDGTLGEVHVVYNAYVGQEKFAPTARVLLPPPIPPGMEEEWPETIVETEPEELFQHLTDELALMYLYIFVLESIAGEQAARFRAMESAAENADKLIDELTLLYHSALQHSITMEMLDLSTSVRALEMTSGRAGY
jgi:F-type H+-transporting ATPase subunit gamma